MTLEEMKSFVRQHFEDFVNRRKLDVADVNFSTDFVDHGTDVPPGTPPGPQGAKQYVGAALERFPDMHVTIDDIIAEGDKVVVRNTWTGTDRQSGKRLGFSGIVMWRMRDGKLVERWAYLQAPQAV
jgi:ketosteroid isomerase-like protein